MRTLLLCVCYTSKIKNDEDEEEKSEREERKVEERNEWKDEDGEEGRGSQKNCVFISCSKSECNKVKRMKTERKKKMFLRGRKKK